MVAHTRMNPPLHVGLRRHRANEQAAATRAIPAGELATGNPRYYYWNFTVTADLLELHNIATVAELIVLRVVASGESGAAITTRIFRTPIPTGRNATVWCASAAEPAAIQAKTEPPICNQIGGS